MTGMAIDELVAGYPGRTVLRQVTARIPASAVTALVGPNGSGKSTLLGVLAGVIPATSGTVERPRAPAFVMQRSDVPDALPITVRDTVAMGRWAHRGPWRRLSRHDWSIVDGCLARLDILDLAARPLGSLSGGQRQRALVAQGLAQESEVLLLDEPTTGLDAKADLLIQTALAAAKAAGVTVVHATHDLPSALRADHCLLLDDGRLVAEGPPHSVLTPR
ncbi:ABC transporter ATP-binding protein [Nonomuraea glycinis]|uniref:ABC transporter ATP-binding protein n=2 Tax=Nonomuraea glycinis TaxID=2047744 RepID=A0A917ZZR8_9ACTN|nr:ABC transporter ATP-binding protein [Nonomuraea glycinis]